MVTIYTILIFLRYIFSLVNRNGLMEKFFYFSREKRFCRRIIVGPTHTVGAITREWESNPDRRPAVPWQPQVLSPLEWLRSLHFTRTNRFSLSSSSIKFFFFIQSNKLSSLNFLQWQNSHLDQTEIYFPFLTPQLTLSQFSTILSNTTTTTRTWICCL